MTLAARFGSMAVAALAISVAALTTAVAAQSAHVRSSTEYEKNTVGRRELVSAKTGSIIDADTGIGVPDVTVIASWILSSSSWEHDSSGCVARRIVSTDANGNFQLPDVSAETWFSPPQVSFKDRLTAPSGHSEFSWRLAVFKPGYLRDGDELILKAHAHEIFAFGWEEWPPKVVATHTSYQLRPIRIRSVSLSPANEFVYLSKVQRFANCDPNPASPPSPEHEVLLKRIAMLIRPIPCSLPELTPIPAWAAQAFYGLGGGGDSKSEPFFQSGQGTADTFYSRMSIAAAGGPMSVDWRDTSAGSLCWAQGGRGTRP